MIFEVLLQFTVNSCKYLAEKISGVKVIEPLSYEAIRGRQVNCQF